ncbi:hypothetical protein [Meiothermus sp.]|uniref:hypothetical protein n=1 Tax=Meiothermus sp. TaxID=1955249 RepID=UPI00307CF704
MDDPSDTHPQVARLQLDLLRQSSPARRLQLMASMSALVIGLSRSNLEQQLGDAQSAKVEWVRLHYGSKMAQGLISCTRPSRF